MTSLADRSSRIIINHNRDDVRRYVRDHTNRDKVNIPAVYACIVMYEKYKCSAGLTDDDLDLLSKYLPQEIIDDARHFKIMIVSEYPNRIYGVHLEREIQLHLGRYIINGSYCIHYPYDEIAGDDELMAVIASDSRSCICVYEDPNSDDLVEVMSDFTDDSDLMELPEEMLQFYVNGNQD